MQNLIDPIIQGYLYKAENYARVLKWTLQKPAPELISLQDIQNGNETEYTIYEAFIILWSEELGKERFEQLWDGILDKYIQGLLSVYLMVHLKEELPKTLLEKLEKSSAEHLLEHDDDQDPEPFPYYVRPESPPIVRPESPPIEHEDASYDDYLMREIDAIGNSAGGLPLFPEDRDFEKLFPEITREHVLGLPAASAMPTPSSAGGPAASAMSAPVGAGGYFVRAPPPVQDS
jgi:hypothetical protein